MISRFSLLLFFAAILLSLASKGPQQKSQQCSSMVGTPLQSCTVAGYNSTFPIPYYMNKNTNYWVGAFLNFTLKMTESNNCSIGLQRMGEMVTCAIYVPKCKDGNVMLPCKRVCVEYFKKCDSHINPFWFDYFIAHCTLLPDYAPSSGKCFEPPNFEQNFNSTSTDIVHGKCHNVIFPWCKDIGYQYTIMKESTQIVSYRYMYKKNFTNTSEDNVFPNNSAIQYWTNFQKNYSKCAKNIQKMLCADLFPPCYPHEGTAVYSICHETCLEMRNTCPSIAKHSTFLGNFFNSCEAMATESPTHGYCKRTTWPKPLLWLKYFRERIPEAKTFPPSPPLPVYVIVILVVIPLVSISVVAAVFIWRNRKLPWFISNFRRGEDTKDIIQDEVEENAKA